MSLTEIELQRYSRQILLPGIGPEGQELLRNARALLIGVGGLGSPAALYLAAAGVGTLGLVDNDTVSVSNLQRQILYDTQATGRLKVSEARQRLSRLNPLIKIETFDQALTLANARELFSKFDLVLDGTDNFKTRHLISQACLETGKPHIYAGIFQFEGQVAIFEPGRSACYRCLFPETPKAIEIPNCSEAGVLGALPGIIGSTQALETLKFILKFPQSKSGQLFVFDALHLDTRTLMIPQRSDCDHCGPSAKSFDERIKSQDPIESLQATRQIALSESAPENAIWLDVRSADEFQLGHRAGALNIPIQKIADELAELSKTQTYVVYCASGKRSFSAQSLLLRHGFADVWNIREGLVFSS